MPWVRIDEHFADHPKVVQAGPEGMALYVAGLCYCNRFQTDGIIPPSKARTLLDLPDVDTTIKRLVTASLWEEQADGRFQVHDYLEYQPSKEEVAEERRKRQAAGKAGGLAKARASAKAKPVAKTYPGSVPDPGSETASKPEPAEEASSPPAEDDMRFSEFWEAYPKRNGKRIGRDKALKVWMRRSKVDRVKALTAVENYRRACDDGLTIAQDAHRWLSGGTFNDWMTPAESPPPKDRMERIAEELGLTGREGTNGTASRAGDQARGIFPA